MSCLSLHDDILSLINFFSHSNINIRTYNIYSMVNIVNFKGFKPERVFSALVNKAHPIGTGLVTYDGKSFTADNAKSFLNDCKGNVGYVKGRIINVNFNTFPMLNSYDYNNFNGANLMYKVLEDIRWEKDNYDPPQPLPKEEKDLIIRIMNREYIK